MMSDKVEKDISIQIEPRIAIVGIGGAGCNVTNEFYNLLPTSDIIAINTDKKALEESSADKKLFICKEVTKGEGTKGDIKLGKKCAQVHREDIENTLRGYDVAFIIAGLGGGTGTGATSVVAEICDHLNLMTFVITMSPFSFESDRHAKALEGLRSIKAVCSNTIMVENDKILDIMPDATLDAGMRAINKSIINSIEKTISLIPNYLQQELNNTYKIMSDSNNNKLNMKDISEFISSAMRV